MVILETILEDVSGAGRSVEWWKGEVERRLQDSTGEWAAVAEAAVNVTLAAAQPPLLIALPTAVPADVGRQRLTCAGRRYTT